MQSVDLGEHFKRSSCYGRGYGRERNIEKLGLAYPSRPATPGVTKNCAGLVGHRALSGFDGREALLEEGVVPQLSCLGDVVLPHVYACQSV